jgi:hypothetical protein
MSTKKTPTFAERLATAEDAHQDRQRHAREALAAARERVERTAAALEQAEDALTDQRADYAADDDTEVTPETYAAAKAGHELLQARLANAKARQRRLTDAADVNTSVEAAEALVRIVQQAVPDVPVYVCSTTPSAPVHTDELPVVVIRQTENTRRHGDGAIYAVKPPKQRKDADVPDMRERIEFGGPGVEIRYYRTKLHAPLVSERIEDAARNDSARVEVMYGGEGATAGDGVLMDSAALKVVGILPGVIEVNEPDPMALAREFAYRAAEATGIRGWTLKRSGIDGWQSTALEAVPQKSGTSILSSTVSEGVRTQRVQAVVAVTLTGGGGNSLDALAALPEVARSLAHATIPSLGLVSEVRYDKRGDTVTLTATVQSTAPSPRLTEAT